MSTPIKIVTITIHIVEDENPDLRYIETTAEAAEDQVQDNSGAQASLYGLRSWVDRHHERE